MLGKRRAFLGPLERGMLDTLQLIARADHGDSEGWLTGPKTVLYGSLVQAGLDQLELLGPRLQPESVPAVIGNRLVVIEKSSWGQLSMLVGAIMKEHMPAGELAESDRFRLSMVLKCFITGLLYALDSGQHMVLLSTMKELREMATQLPSSLRVPLTNLMSLMQAVEPEVAVPCTSVDKVDVALFSELLASPFYERYQEGHCALADERRSTDESMCQLAEAAHELCKRNSRILRKRKVTAVVVPLATKDVGQVFGDLSASLAAVTEKLVQAWVARNARLVVYELGEPFRELMPEHRSGASDDQTD